MTLADNIAKLPCLFKQRGIDRMANIISLQDSHCFDYEAAIDEIEIIVPKYLDVLRQFEEAESFEDIPNLIQNVETYWRRLLSLLNDIQKLEEDPNLHDAIISTQQSELSTLERIYLKVNERIHFSESQWTEGMWRAAETILLRMDTLLEALNFEENHEDRILIREMQQGNVVKEQKSCRFRQTS
jgi:hypothetical protein